MALPGPSSRQRPAPSATHGCQSAAAGAPAVQSTATAAAAGPPSPKAAVTSPPISKASSAVQSSAVSAGGVSGVTATITISLRLTETGDQGPSGSADTAVRCCRTARDRASAAPSRSWLEKRQRPAASFSQGSQPVPLSTGAAASVHSTAAAAEQGAAELEDDGVLQACSESGPYSSRAESTASGYSMPLRRQAARRRSRRAERPAHGGGGDELPGRGGGGLGIEARLHRGAVDLQLDPVPGVPRPVRRGPRQRRGRGAGAGVLERAQLPVPARGLEDLDVEPGEVRAVLATRAPSTKASRPRRRYSAALQRARQR